MSADRVEPTIGPNRIARLRPLAIAVAAAMAPAGAAFALPVGEQVVAGQVGVARPSAQSMVVQQGSAKAIVNWQGFSIGVREAVQFQQPGASSVILNRVIGGNASEIAGRLSANGQVFLVNPNGVLFGGTARVDVGGLVASSLSIGNEDFLAGRYRFAGSGGPGPVSNQGVITARDGGFVALLGGQVNNDGTISARLGTAALAAGNKMTLDFAGDGLIRVAVEEAAVNAAVRNQGMVIADGGEAILTARSVEALAQGAVNQTGMVRARTLTEREGKIVLDGGPSGRTLAGGTLDASGTESGQKGGEIRVLGQEVGITGSAVLDARGDAGGGTVLIGGDFQGANPAIPNARATWIGPDATIRADALTQGDGGKVVAWSDEVTRVHGTISARGGPAAGNGGLIETSGKQLDTRGLRVDASAPRGKAGQWLLDPADLTITNGDDDSGTVGGPDFTTSGDPAQLRASTIEASLNTGTSVSVTTTNPEGSEGFGDITIAEGVSIDKTAGGNAALGLNAIGSITMGPGAAIRSTSGALDVEFNSDRLGALDVIRGGAIVMQPGSVIETNGGSVRFFGQSNRENGRARGVAIVLPTQSVVLVPNGISLDSATINTCVGGSSSGCTAASGDIVMRGLGATSVASFAAFQLVGGAPGVVITDSALRTSTGAIELDGRGGGAGLGARITGTPADGSGCAASVCSGSGPIRIAGEGGGLGASQTPNVEPGTESPSVPHGLSLTAPIRTQSGEIEISGTGGNWSSAIGTSAAVDGVQLTPDIQSATMNRIVVSGSGAQDGSTEGGVVNAYGVRVGPGSILNPGGQVVLQGGTLGTELGANIDVSSANAGAVGGEIRVLGGRVGIIGTTTLDATGSGGGGRILVGGGQNGADASVPNAAATFVGSTVTLDASATTMGNGGSVVIWGNDATRAHGIARANAGPAGGNGGLVETSGAFLDVNGIRVSAAAPMGAPGTWLIDPIDVTISRGATSGAGGPPDFTAAAPGANVQDADIQNALNGGTSVSVSTGAGTAGQGNITLINDVDSGPAVIDKTAGGDATLRLNAHNYIWLQEGVRITSSAGRLNVDLNSDSDGNGVGPIILGQIGGPAPVELRTNGGNVRMFGQSDPADGRARGELAAAGAPSPVPNAVQLFRATIDTTSSNGGASGNVLIRGQAGARVDAGTQVAGIGVALAFDTAISTGSGTITLDGIGGQGTANATGDGAGVFLDQARLSADTGTITLIGRGSASSSLQEPGGDGVRLHPLDLAATNSITTTSGAIVINGAGGSGGNVGGSGVSTSNSSLQTGSGNITITGTGGAGGVGFDNTDGDGTGGGAGGVGVLLGPAAGPVIQTSSGVIQIASFGGDGGGGGSGINSGSGGNGGAGFDGGGATILTGSALAQIGGSGGNGGTGGNCDGTGSFCGTGGSGGTGVLLGGLIQAAGGGVQISGVGGDGAKGGDGTAGTIGGFIGSGGNGISTSNAASIIGTSGSITLNGTAGQGGPTSLVDGVPRTGLLYQSFSGTGVVLFGAGNPTIGTTSGDISITGLATSTDRGATGVGLFGATIETIAGGSIDIRGRGDAPATSSSTGVDIFTSSTIRTQGAPGRIVISGESTGAGFGVVFGEEGGTNLIGGPTTSGHIVIRAANAGGGDSIDLVGNTTIQTTGVINLRPGGVSALGALTPDNGETIEIGPEPVPAPAPGPSAPFRLSPAELDTLADGAAAIVVGGNTHSGPIRLLTPYAFKDNVTLQNAGAGSQGIALEAALSSPGNLIALSSAGLVTQAATAPIAAAALLLQGTGPGDFLLTNSGNAVSQFDADSPVGGQVRFENTGALTIGPLTGTGFDSATNTPTAISAPNTVSFGDLFVRTTGNLSLAHSISTIGSDIDLVTGGIFINAGGGALLPGGGGSWRVWASTWEGENRGGLVPTSPFPNFYGCTYPGVCTSGVVIPTSGNRFIYVQRPTVTVTADDKIRPAGLANPPLTFTASGLVNGDTQTDAVSVALSCAATPSSPAGAYPIEASATSPVGYNVVTVNGTLTVTQLTVPGFTNDAGRVTATQETLLYDRNTGAQFVCTPTGPLVVPAETVAGSDGLAREWSRVRVRPNLTNCMGIGERGGCDDF